MFYLLRRIILTIMIGSVACLVVFLYQKRFVFTPIVDFYEAFQISQESPRRALESISGEVTKITAEYAFQMKNDAGLVFVFQLTGLEPPSPQNSTDEMAAKLKEESRTRLEQLIVSRRVRVEVNYLNEKRSGLGIVYLGETNINAALVEAGLARLNRNYLKGLSVGPLYELLRAERKAKEKKLGVWKE